MKPRFVTFAALAALAAAGLIAALGFPPVANAWDWNALPNGYSVQASSYQLQDGSSCHQVTIDGHYMGDDCVDVSAFNAAVNAYIDSTICTVSPAAGGSACAPSTTTAASTQVTTTPPPDTTPTTTADPPPPPPTVTVTVTAPDVQAQIDDLKSQVATLKGRVDKLEAAADAEWLSYHDALVAGLDPIVASMVARQTGYDLIHGTGPFAP